MKHSLLNYLNLNIKWLLAGIFLLILGYIILAWTPSGNKSYEETVFAWHKLTLAPIILLTGYVCMGVSIMIKGK
ncbi:MAG TPA: DUF3098 domain-containing protein [Bacteroidales bacterium]